GHLSQGRPGDGIVRIEAGVRGNGASGRSGGQVLHGVNGVRTDDPDELRRIHAATGMGIDLAESLAGQHAPAGTFRRHGVLEVYTDAGRAEAAHARAEGLAQAGIPVRFLAARELPIEGVHGALLDPTSGRLRPSAGGAGGRAAAGGSSFTSPRPAPVWRGGSRSPPPPPAARCARVRWCSRPTATRRHSGTSGTRSFPSTPT